jgi:hypothetical protein
VGRVGVVGAALAVWAVVPAAAFAHQERPTQFPDPSRGHVPAYRTSGPFLVVCKPSSTDRIERLPDGPLKRENEHLLAECRFSDIQAAVTAASSGTRILVLPGIYEEQPSRRAPYPDPGCSHFEVLPAVGPGMVPGYAYQRRCPNAQNLIAIVGDADDDGVCDDKCNLQIEGTGATPSEVVIRGDRRKLNIIRADRADGIFLRNFTVEYSDFNNIYVVETNGFHLDPIVSRWSREYGYLSFTSDHGLYENLVAYGAGDAGVYPGSGPEGHCTRYGIEIRNVDSYDNTFGLSGNSGNGLWVHDDRFHDNATGVLVGSLGPGHPGQPQDCSKFEHNRIYSNNLDVYAADRRTNCRQLFAERDPTRICPAAPAPVGSGLMILGGNRNLVRANWVYDNWRNGVRLGWAPVQEGNAPGSADGLQSILRLVLRNIPEIARRQTSHANRFLDNQMGVRPDGSRAPNGLDFQWDGEGRRNCWSGNQSTNGLAVTSNTRLPACPGRSYSPAPTARTIAQLVACSSWRATTNPHPRGCSWFAQPAKPSFGVAATSHSRRNALLIATALLVFAAFVVAIRRRRTQKRR